MNADPDPATQINADPDPDTDLQPWDPHDFNADPDPAFNLNAVPYRYLLLTWLFTVMRIQIRLIIKVYGNLRPLVYRPSRAPF